MSRGVLLVAAADPFLDAYWFRNFATWRDQVDELKIIVNAVTESALRDYIATKAAEVGGEIVEFSPALDHGVAIGRVMPHMTSDVVLLMEEDAFVREPSKIGECFGRIERGEVDVVGCPRATGTPEVIALGNSRFGELAAGTGEAGPLFWPCFLFAKRADLERVGNYSTWGAQAGETFLGRTFDTEQAMDTFGYASLMLRESGARVHVEPNYRADYSKMDLWGLTPWFHVGSLSTGFGKYIMGPRAHNGIWAALRGTDLTDWCKRVAFWELMAERGDELNGVRDAYIESVAELERETGMDRSVINDWRAKFERLMN